ncbi:meiotic nuclear division protein 1 [Dipodascopsis uninucleata]
MSRKGISAEEKCSRLLAFFRESFTFYGIKDIEKQGAKATGINSMQIKDVLQSLVDDGLVRCEKIGSGNFYWSFPSDASRQRDLALQTTKKNVASANEAIVLLEEQLAAEKVAREPTPERETLLVDVEARINELASLKEQVNASEGLNPELIQRQQAYLEECKEAVNRWTDNIFAVLAYFREQGTDMKLVYQEFNIPEELENV